MGERKGSENSLKLLKDIHKASLKSTINSDFLFPRSLASDKKTGHLKLKLITFTLTGVVGYSGHVLANWRAPSVFVSTPTPTKNSLPVNRTSEALMNALGEVSSTTSMSSSFLRTARIVATSLPRLFLLLMLLFVVVRGRQIRATP